jgi:cysteine desulfuration protein SufE
MNDLTSTLPARLQEIVAEFELCEGREKLELLLQYSQQLPPLPEHLRAHRDQMEMVEECISPVFFHGEWTDGRVEFHLDVPEEAPTVRGFAAILWQGLNGCTPAEIAAVPAEFYTQMGLGQVLSGQRLNGIRAILGRIKRFAAQTAP